MNALWGLLLLACALAPGSEAIKCLCANIGCITGEGGQDEECPDKLPKQYEDKMLEIRSKAVQKLSDAYIDFIDGLKLNVSLTNYLKSDSNYDDKFKRIAKWLSFFKGENAESLLGIGSAYADGKGKIQPQETINNQFCMKAKIGDAIIRGCGAIVSYVGEIKMDEGCVVYGPRFGYCRCNEDLCNVGDVTDSSSVTISQGRAVYILSSLLVMNWSWLSSCPL